MSASDTPRGTAANESTPYRPRIDHTVIYAGSALDDAAARYRRLGFHMTPRGHHSMGSSNHLLIFRQDYVELLGVEPQNVVRFGRGWDHPTGLSGLVFKTDDAVALWDRLTAAGVALEGKGPDAFSRPVTLENGKTEETRFRVVRLALNQIPNGRVFFCEQQTPELVWRAPWQQHPNGVDGLLEYVFAIDDPDALAQRLSTATGAPIQQTEGGPEMPLGSATVRFLSPRVAAQHFGVEAGALPGPLPRAVGLTLHTRSLQTVQDLLRTNGVPSQRNAAGHIIVSPEDAAGTFLAFSRDSRPAVQAV